MIVDAIINALLAIFSPIVDLLPEYDLPAPDASPIVTWLARVDSFVPIAPVLTAAIVLLGFLAVFLTWRLVLVIRHVLLP